jgi:hypothetical protein
MRRFYANFEIWSDWVQSTYIPAPVRTMVTVVACFSYRIALDDVARSLL